MTDNSNRPSQSNKKIVIVTPAAPHSRSGNRNTATRWSRILRGLGYQVHIVTEWRGERADLLVALHARRSHASLKALRHAVPGVPAILALTGTDIYRDIRISNDAAASLELATRLVVLQDAALEELTPGQRTRAHVIYQSEVAHVPHHPPRRLFRLCVLGHLRDEKDPFRAVLALQYLPPDAKVEVVQAGRPLTPEMEAEARMHASQDPRYRWLGEVPHWRALRLLAHSHAMVISSRMEGGAHVVSEAIAHGVPVIASYIAGNRGMLGEDYAGYYPLGNEEALAARIRRAMSEPAYLEQLKTQVLARQPLVTPQREVAAWRGLLGELL